MIIQTSETEAIDTNVEYWETIMREISLSHTCENCMHWGFYKPEQCMPIKRYINILLNIDQQYGKYGAIDDSDLIDGIETDYNFGCILWKKR